MTTITALFIPADGQQAPELRELDTTATLDTLQQAVGGYIEALHLPGMDADMFINEEGKILGLPPNERATFVWGSFYGTTTLGDYIAGDAIITGGPNENGDTTGMDPLQVREVTSALQQHETAATTQQP